MDKNIYKDITAVGVLLVAAFVINRGISIHGLYMDDLYMWSCYGEQSFLQYVFPIGSTRFRFVYYLIAYVVLALTGTHITWLVPVNILLNTGIAITIYFMGRKWSRSRVAGCMAGLLYLVSRMSYYQIGQMYGMMETFATWTTLGIFYCCFQYGNREKTDRKAFILANVLYFLICFIHERYMVLLPMLFLVLIFRKPEKKRDWLIPPVVFAAVQLIRCVTIGTVLPAGTGRSDVVSDFSLGQTVKFALEEVACVFGINLGPEHLCGRSFANSPLLIRLLVLGSVAAVLIMTIRFAFLIIRNNQSRKIHLFNSLLFLGFIAGCIAASSVTIRVELRWVYVSYTLAVLWLTYMYGALTDNGDKVVSIRKVLPCALLAGAYFVLIFPAELYYRSCYSNLYLWPNQQRYNSLAEETYEKYGTDIFGKTIYILGRSYEMSQFTADTFFKVFDPERKAEGTTVRIINSIHDIGLVDDHMLVIREDPSHNAFQDVTEFIRNIKCEILDGYYRDGWMDEEADVRIMAGSSGEIKAELIFPGDLRGYEIVRIQVNGEDEIEVPMEENVQTVSIAVQPYESLQLHFSNNFIMPDAQEQRGSRRLSMIVNFTAD